MIKNRIFFLKKSTFQQEQVLFFCFVVFFVAKLGVSASSNSSPTIDSAVGFVDSSNMPRANNRKKRSLEQLRSAAPSTKNMALSASSDDLRASDGISSSSSGGGSAVVARRCRNAKSKISAKNKRRRRTVAPPTVTTCVECGASRTTSNKAGADCCDACHEQHSARATTATATTRSQSSLASVSSASSSLSSASSSSSLPTAPSTTKAAAANRVKSQQHATPQAPPNKRNNTKKIARKHSSRSARRVRALDTSQRLTTLFHGDVGAAWNTPAAVSVLCLSSHKLF